MNTSTTTNKEAIAHLRVGWYGNIDEYDSYDDDNRPPYMKRREPVDYNELFRHCIDLANTKYILLCDGIEGTMDNLVVNEDHVRIVEGLPIHIRMLDIPIVEEVAVMSEGEAEGVLHPI